MSDASRFAALVLPHLDAAYNLARWLTRDPSDADDVVQDACVRALRYIGAARTGDARPWLLTIVRRAFYDWLARNRPGDMVGEEALADLAAPGPGPEQAALARADADALEEALAALPLPYREVLVLREIEELSYKQIADVADIPIGTVMSRLARARAMLQRSPLLREVREAAGSRA